MLAAGTDQPTPWNFGVFGIGAIVFVVLSTWLYYTMRQLSACTAVIERKDALIQQLQVARLEDALAASSRERQLQERTIPILGETAKFLEASLAQARSTATQKEINDTVERFEAMVQRMERRDRE